MLNRARTIGIILRLGVPPILNFESKKKLLGKLSFSRYPALLHASEISFS